ncbi:WD repeat-containing protein [Candida maltosa Xu316]|uniref:DNA damage-binding protein CMR1 n=1 Tax=Candida maltosa (strain Xu316) TaxID=1245528 RepID=M3ILP7_CANMX|nr:WD repeat-containing protein [Candida maltosa Xu316]
MGLSELERKRQENIKRNKELLSKLALDSISTSIKKEIDNAQPVQKKRKSTPKKKTVVKSEPVEPTRRSRRIAGIKTDPTELAEEREKEEKKQQKKDQMEALKRTRLFGDFNLIDLITNKSGNMIHEDKIIPKVKDEEEEEEFLELSNGKKTDQEDLDDQIDENNRVLKLIQSLGDKFSAGDFYDIISDSQKKDGDKSLEAKRKEFDKLHIYERFDPLDIKICHQRITAMYFHPSTTDRIVTAGDTGGNLGIWLVDDASEDPSVTILHSHGRNISKILTPTFAPEKLYTASYDGSVRTLDLNKLTSTELLHMGIPGESANDVWGVSDINQVQDSHTIFLTTLEGQFYQHDTRVPFKRVDSKKILRLHDKKIGSFTVNPNNDYQIATASLDRSLRIWDLRKVSNSEYSQYEGQKSPHLYGNCTSRLSVSCVDWNQENRLVCNGYDDNICLFNYNGTEDLPVITEWDSTYQPSTTKKNNKKEATGDDYDELPDNLTPFTKIRHNCQTGRWVSILKSKWQSNPADGVQKFIIANMNRGLDIYNQHGEMLAHLNESVGAVPAVCALHPTQNWAVGGSASSKVYLFE